MISLLFILVAHYIADWGLQSEFVSKNKGKYSLIMFSHCFMWAGVVSIALYYFNLFAWWKFLYLLIIHWIGDSIKDINLIKTPCSENKKVEKHNYRLLYEDQILHFIQCVLVWAIRI